ncbi:MAG: ATP-binding protein [Saprospiraceae bacterium]
MLQGLMLHGQSEDRSEHFLFQKIESETTLREEIRQVVRDSMGFYWFSTINGLYRFDGVKNKHFPLSYFDFELPGIFFLAKDYRQILWFYSVKWQSDAYLGRRLKQLRIFDPYQSRVMKLSEYLPGLPFREEDITQISAAEDRILIVLSDYEVYEFGPGGLERKFSTENDRRILDICYCQVDSSYYFTAEGKILGRHTDGSIRTLPVPEKLSPPTWLRCSSNALFYYNGLEISGLNYGGFYLPITGQFRTLDLQQRLHYLNNDGKDLWIFSRNNKLLVYRSLMDGTLTEPFEISFSGQDLEYEVIKAASILGDNIWVSFFRDQFVIREKRDLFDCYLSDGRISIRDIYEDSDSSLLLTTYMGHRYFHNKTKSFSTLFKTFDQQATGFGIAANDNYIALGMHNAKGLFLYNRQTGEERIAPFNENGDNLFGRGALIPFTDRQGTIWVALKSGLGRLDPNAKYVEIIHSPEMHSILNARINGVTPWNDDFWLSTSKGLYLFDPEKIRLTDSLDLLSGKTYVHAQPVSEELVWVVPENDNVYLWDRVAQKLDTVFVYRPEWQNSIHAMLPDAYGAYWMPSNNGLFRLDTQSGEIDRFTQKHDMLTSNEFNKLSWEILHDGRIALGGINGMMILDPAEFADRSFRPASDPLRFTEVIEVREGREANLGMERYIGQISPPRISPGLDQIIFRFRYLDVIPQDIIYYYRLDAASSETPWQRTEEPQLIFNKLRDGSHVLEVGVKQVLNPAFIDRASLRFYIMPPWYRTWWMLIVYVLSVISLIRLIIQYRIRVLKKEKAELERIVQERTAEINRDKQYIEQQNRELEKLNDIKDKLFAILGHELRSPLLSVTGMSRKVAYLLKHDEKELIEKVSRQLDQNARNVAGTLEGLIQWGRRLIDDRLPAREAIALHALVEEVNGALAEQFVDKQLSVNNLIPEDLKVNFDKESLEIILRNLLHNAFKFSDNATAVTIKSRCEPDGRTEIRISDQGAGLPAGFEEQWRKNQLLDSRRGSAGEKGIGLGLLICRTLAQRNDAELYLRNLPTGGMCAGLIWINS